jgi:NDP-sugar pyrophosphorylase family protein
MKAMILAAGVGSRLGEITKDKPKCLVEVKGEPLIKHVIDRLIDAGVTSFVINAHHFAEKVKDYIDSLKLDAVVLVEKHLLGTGGGLLNAKDYLSGDFFLHNADVLSEINLNALYLTHQEQRNLATLAVMKRETKRALIFNKDMTLKGWSNDGITGNRYGFCGVQVLSDRIFQFLKPSGSTIDAFVEASSKGERVVGYDIGESFWVDVGTPERYKSVI